jgi:CheY-like chemotaxis protein
MMISSADILNAKILIVDDLETNVRLLERVLRGAGYTNIDFTMNPEEASPLHQKNHYDLILLDLLMAGMDGFAVMEALKSVETGGYLPILVITAQPDHKLRALQAGAKDFVTKPFDLVEMKTRIHNMLEVRLLYQRLEIHNKSLEQTVLERTAELRASEERFHRLTELSSDWYWEQDTKGIFTDVSGPALEMLRVGGAALEENIAARRPFLDLVYSRTNIDGSEQFFQVSGEPIFDPSGCYTGYRGVGMDVTARMRPATNQS